MTQRNITVTVANGKLTAIDHFTANADPGDVMVWTFQPGPR
jgi:hypothetical protein